MISARQLSKQYDALTAIENISFDLTYGNTMALLGPNGAGKTTIMECLMGMVPFEGEVDILGLDPSEDGKAVRKRVGYLPQRNSLYEGMSIVKNMKYWADMRGASRRSIAYALEKAGLQAYGDVPIGKLSAGMKQRAMFAASLIGDPEVLLLDEPTTNLDPKWRMEFKKIIKSLKKERAVIIASNSLKETQELCNGVLILDQGKEVASGEFNSIVERLELPHHLYINVSSVERAARLLQNIDYSTSVKDNWIAVLCGANEKLSILNALHGEGYTIRDFRAEEPTLEDVFLKVTGKGIGIRIG